MKHRVELSIIEPMYSTYQFQIPGTAILENNPSIRNWYLSHALILSCSRSFLNGYSSPQLNVVGSSWNSNPYFDKKIYDMQFLKGHSHYVIRNLLDEGYYVYFTNIDDYYVEGKSWYQERHFPHDGCICGYDRENKTYCLFAYDKDWRCQKFWTTQSSFDKGRRACFKKGQYGVIYGIKPKQEQVDFFLNIALDKIHEYLDSSMEKYPETTPGVVSGIVVHEYLAKYLDMLYDGAIPYEKIDRRIFRLIWEHKKTMLESIRNIEKALSLDDSTSATYEKVVKEADTARMIYASHVMKRRDSLLPIIKNKLLSLEKEERAILEKLLQKVDGGKKE